MAEAARDWPFEDAAESLDWRRLVLIGIRDADGDALCRPMRLTESGGVG